VNTEKLCALLAAIIEAMYATEVIQSDAYLLMQQKLLEIRNESREEQ
jgi:hypothetical protein